MAFVSLHIRNMNLLSAALITQERMRQFLIFSKVVRKKKKKPKQSSISTRAPLMYHERLWLLSLHLIRCLFSSHARKPVMGKLQKGETGRAPGPSEVLSKAFPCYALSHRYSSCQLKSEDGKNFGLEKNFSTSERHLATGLSIWKKEGKKIWNSRNGRDFQTETHVKESDTAFGERSKNEYGIVLQWKEEPGTYRECWFWLALCAHIHKINFTCHSKHIFKLSIYSQSNWAPSVCACTRQTEIETIERERLCVCVCVWWWAHVYALATTISNTLLDRILLRTVVLRRAVKRKV